MASEIGLHAFFCAGDPPSSSEPAARQLPVSQRLTCAPIVTVPCLLSLGSRAPPSPLRRGWVVPCWVLGGACRRTCLGHQALPYAQSNAVMTGMGKIVRMWPWPKTACHLPSATCEISHNAIEGSSFQFPASRCRRKKSLSFYI